VFVDGRENEKSFSLPPTKTLVSGSSHKNTEKHEKNYGIYGKLETFGEERGLELRHCISTSLKHGVDQFGRILIPLGYLNPGKGELGG
jgi:hypothetical protein